MPDDECVRTPTEERRVQVAVRQARTHRFAQAGAQVCSKCGGLLEVADVPNDYGYAADGSGLVCDCAEYQAQLASRLTAKVRHAAAVAWMGEGYREASTPDPVTGGDG